MSCTLSPILGPHLKLLFIGQNPARESCESGVYFTSRTKFWSLLCRSNLTEETLVRKESKKVTGDDKKLLDYGIGITDLIHTVGRFTPSLFTGDERNRLEKEIEKSDPDVLVFIGKKAYEVYSGIDAKCYGPQERYLDRHVFVLPFPTTTPMPDEHRIVMYNDLAQILQNVEYYRIPNNHLLINAGCDVPSCGKCLIGNCTDVCCTVHTLDKKYQFRLRAGIIRTTKST